LKKPKIRMQSDSFFNPAGLFLADTKYKNLTERGDVDVSLLDWRSPDTGWWFR